MEHTSRAGIRSVVLVAALVAPLLLAGCSVAVTDPASSASPAASDPRGSMPDAPDASSAPDAPSAPDASPAPDAESSTEVDPDVRAQLDRTRLRELVTQNLTCVDGSATVGRDLDGMYVELTGDCTTVTILASAGGVLLPEVGTVTIKGDGATVLMTSATRIAFDKSADINVVGWESGTPDIAYAGTANITTPLS
ncbi:hypothetical protein ACH0CG_08270 [Microbacterium sp. 179-I 1D1 NHS]|uniref:hypothetical protein n=1 Tax=Microbacterium sp. 179-I 1D1 NHS TaxID=3374298 RepID=UPI003879E848